MRNKIYESRCWITQQDSFSVYTREVKDEKRPTVGIVVSNRNGRNMVYLKDQDARALAKTILSELP